MSSKNQATPAASSMSLMAHLVELRNRLFKCFLMVALGALLGWFLFSPVLNILTRPLIDLCKHQRCIEGAQHGRFLNTDILDPLTTRIKISMYIGIVVAMPVLLWQLWRFIAPGLYANERKYSLAFIGPALVLFLFGCFTAYFILPVSLNWLQGVGGSHFEAGYSASSFVTLLGWMMIAFGAAFEFPVVLVGLMAVRILKVQVLIKQWRYFIAGITVVAAVITPTADPFTFMFMAIPMVVLYGISIIIGLGMERARRQAD